MQLRLRRTLSGEETVFLRIGGFGPDPGDNSFVIANARTGAAVEFKGNRPLEYFNFWAASGAICPEPALAIAVAPGATFTWSSSYRFFQTEAPHGGRQIP